MIRQKKLRTRNERTSSPRFLRRILFSSASSPLSLFLLIFFPSSIPFGWIKFSVEFRSRLFAGKEDSPGNAARAVDIPRDS